MRNLASSFLALLLTLTVFSATAAPAFASAPAYRAEPATPQPAAKLIVRDIVWKCGASGCTAPRGNSRPAIDCAALAREVGALRSFAIGGEPLSAEQLEKCNARAR